MKNYNGFASWNQWNVSLWVNNEEYIYRFACELVKLTNLNNATKLFMQSFDKTPDGAVYNRLSVYRTLKDLKNDLNY